MTITKEQLSKLPSELILKAVNACMEYEKEYGETQSVYEVRTEVKEKLNAKKKVDYSVLVKHKIDCVDKSGNIFIPTKRDLFGHEGDSPCFQPRTNHWFSALNFEDVDEVIIDLREAGFDIDEDRDETYSVCDAFKINGVAEGCEF